MNRRAGGFLEYDSRVDDWLTIAEAQAYIADRHGKAWSREWIRKLFHEGYFRWRRVSPALTGRIDVSRDSIDARFAEAAEPGAGDFRD